MRFLRETWRLIRLTFIEFFYDNGLHLAAAAAFYSLLSLAPVILIVLMLASAIWSDSAARDEIARELRDVIGEAPARGLQDVIQQGSRPDIRTPAAAWSLVLLIVAGTAVFGQLQSAMNIIWNVHPISKGYVLYFLRKRAVALLMLLIVGALLVAAMVASAVLNILSDWLGRTVPGKALLLNTLNLAASVLIYAILFATTFKILPDAKISWSSALLGAGVTAVLFAIGKYLIGVYLSLTSLGSPYGAAGSLVLLLIWIYYSAIIFFWGAEFTQVWAHRHGEDEIDEHAERNEPKAVETD